MRTPTSWPAESPAMPTTLPGSVRALVWIPRQARVEAGAEVDGTVLLPGSVVEEGARVVRSVLGSGATVGAGASLAGSVLGDGVRVGPGVSLDRVRLGADAARP